MPKIKIPNKGSTTSSASNKKIAVAPNISITEKQHTDLIEYVQARLEFGNEFRQSQIDRYKKIDKEVAGYIILDDDDKLRQLDNDKGYGPKVHDVNIPLTDAQMDEAVTFFTTVFFPEEGAYNAVTESEKQETAKGFSRLMNKHASYYKHFTHFAKGAYSGLKYNLGLWLIEWAENKGSIIQNSENGLGATVLEDQTVMMGNRMEWLDPYNTILDPSVHPTELHEKGEFFATVDVETIFAAKMMEQRGEIVGLNRVVDERGELIGNTDIRYYEQKPEIHGDSQYSSTNDRKTNWVEFLSGGSAKSGSSISGLEFINLYIWLPAKRFGLATEPTFQIWRLTLADMNVVDAERMINAHGSLPLLATVPKDDEFAQNSKSYAEQLLPYQRFSSFQLNVHQRASRKALYNILVYNSKLVPAMANADMLGGKVPMNPNAEDIDINRVVKQFSDVPDTSNTLRDIQDMDALMQKLLPTDILKQVASLERATQYQAAATVQGANRRNLKIAKTIYLQAFAVGLRLQMYNILQFQESVEILDASGTLIKIDPSQLREQQYEFTISDALRGLDKLILVETIKDIIALLVQNPQAAAEFDIADIIDYATTLIGDNTSFKQFRFKNEFDKLNPQQKQIAFQLLQRAMQQQAQQQGGTAPQ